MSSNLENLEHRVIRCANLENLELFLKNTIPEGSIQFTELSSERCLLILKSPDFQKTLAARGNTIEEAKEAVIKKGLDFIARRVGASEKPTISAIPLAKAILTQLSPIPLMYCDRNKTLVDIERALRIQDYRAISEIFRTSVSRVMRAINNAPTLLGHSVADRLSSQNPAVRPAPFFEYENDFAPF